jgi:hypothetical protein
MVAERMMEAVRLVIEERERQEVRKAEGRFKYTCADDGMTNYEKIVVLMEEVGEAAQEALTLDGSRQPRGALGTTEGLRKELIQVAAVSIAHIEALL